MIYYHGSNVEYGFPSIEVIQAVLADSDKASKVALGYYVTPNQKFAGQVGKHVYEVCLNDGAIVHPLDLSKMVRDYDRVSDLPWEEQIEFYKNERVKYLSDDIDLVSIIEWNGSSGESVIVNLNAIQSFKKM